MLRPPRRTNRAGTRKGQRKPCVKAPRKQIEQRIESAALLRFYGLGKSEIHRLFREKSGVEWRQADRYVARARARGASVSR